MLALISSCNSFYISPVSAFLLYFVGYLCTNMCVGIFILFIVKLPCKFSYVALCGRLYNNPVYLVCSLTSIVRGVAYSNHAPSG